MRRAPQDNDNNLPEPDDDADDAGRPSKSALKRQMHSLQSLGQELSELPASRVAKLGLPEALLDALAEYRRIRSHEGRRRQLQFIGKLMRQTDEAPIREAVAAAKLGSAKETLALHEAERWREELLASDDAITRWLNNFPETDAQQLRSLVRAARKDAKAEAVEQRHGRSYREMFQLIKTALAATSASQPDDGEQGEDDDE
ncbi:MAG TPA: ribosome biogenesis factor YjgA [Ideonella sp.]|uniref:ribosome biogenesis factor YjgA n=1 Tax=Ideonella sp. TaxID=1929293 RepID=UPI002E32E731|nr:ribosome biogenesis factor YjgA [Ideonella sp.]HEX5683828.1 ribosome biogenesis factor YjgA [Ideonella sp.]